MDEAMQKDVMRAVAIAFAVFINIMLIPSLIKLAHWTVIQPLWIIALVFSMCVCVICCLPIALRMFFE